MTEPTLAICIPAYNEAEVLPRLLGSIRSQTSPADEVWVYNDGSTDATLQVAASFGARVVCGPGKDGCSFGKNVLAGKTMCDWLHFIDADDALLPCFVANARRWMRVTDPPDVVLFNYEYRDHQTEELLSARSFDDENLRADPIRFTIREQINNVGIYRRERFLKAEGFDLDPLVLYNEDVAMHTRLAQLGLRFRAEKEISLIMYRRSRSMSVANQSRCVRAQYQVMVKAAERVGCSHAADIAYRLWRLAGSAAAGLDWETADACVRLAVRLRGRIPPESGLLFTALCALSPAWGMRVRERLIRLFKPYLRRGM